MTTQEGQNVFAVCSAASGHTVELAMQELMLTGRILPVGSSLVVRHLFQCAERRPVEVIYSFALPRDAAMRRFRIVGEGFSVSSDLKPTAEAVRLYEEGIESGSLSTLARQYRDGVVNLSVGNVRPGDIVAVYLEILAGVELHDDG
ncbi:MAG: VIT domain-containing protein, partial [Verrucomicrobiae bacterium]|nr:VIT domain-containing protein [Verrucomicrobiae bacterium]